MVFAEVDPLTGAGRDAVYIDAADARRLGVVDGDRVRLRSELATFDGTAHLVRLPVGTVQVHWPEGNVLIRHGVVDAIGLVPDYNADVRIEVGERR